MKVTESDQPLLEHSQDAFEAAIADVLTDAQVGAPRRTGVYAASVVTTDSPAGEVLKATIGSPLARAGAVEFGANVGPRRGPHMRGARSTQHAIEKFPDHMTERLRSTPI